MEKTSKGIFINGKAQIIEMLAYMEPEEKNTLLKNIRLRNPQMADELMQESISFQNVLELSEDYIRVLSSYVKPEIFGVSLKTLPQNTQRNILTSLERAYAERAYQVMTTPLSNEARDIKKAREKMANVVGNLVRQKAIRL